MCVNLPRESVCARRPAPIGFLVTSSSHELVSPQSRQKSARSSYASFVMVFTPSHDRALQHLGVRASARRPRFRQRDTLRKHSDVYTPVMEDEVLYTQLPYDALVEGTRRPQSAQHV